MTIRRQQHRKAKLPPSGAAPPYREIQNRIGEGLKEQLELPKEMPHRLLTALIQLTDNEKINGLRHDKKKTRRGRP
jgi:hypothetical protein